MRQVSRLTANYAADLAGVNSVLYELGGLLVMHDASGCNSTYATHDEPRWYDSKSLVYISGLTEYDAVLGNDDKLIDDIVEVTKETNPKFIAIFGSPIALIMGTDFKGIARVIGHRTGIPAFGFKTSGMQSYIDGARQALQGLAQCYCVKRTQTHTDKIRINIIGVTPLDFGVNGNVEALEDFCVRHNFKVQSNWAMGNTLEQISTAPNADVNWVVSSMGVDAAKTLQRNFDTPYVVGLPIGPDLDANLADMIRQTYEDKVPRYIRSNTSGSDVVLIGEPVFTNSLREALKRDSVQVICPMEVKEHLILDGDLCSHDEKDIDAAINQAKLVIADPIYKRLVKKSSIQFVGLPHIAYSGRIYQDEIPEFIGLNGLDNILKNSVFMNENDLY